MHTKVVISGYYGYGNIGDELILRAILQELATLNNKLAITVLSKNPKSTTREHGVDAIYRFNPISLFRIIKQSNILINGGGGLLQDKTSFKSLLYYLFVIWLAKLLKKKVFIWSNGIGPINRSLAVWLSSKLLKTVDAITVRDKISVEILKNWKVEADTTSFAADPVFNLRIPYESFTKNKNLRIGFALRKLQLKEINEIASTINNLSKNCNIIFICSQPSLDMKIINDISPLISKNFEVVILSSFENTFKEIKNLDLLLSMRLHPLIIAAKLKVKILAINNDQKIKELMEELKLEENLIEQPLKHYVLLDKINSSLVKKERFLIPSKLFESSAISLSRFKKLMSN